MISLFIDSLGDGTGIRQQWQTVEAGGARVGRGRWHPDRDLQKYTTERLTTDLTYNTFCGNDGRASMKSSTGRWVSGGDFFDREAELQILETRVRDFNHVLLTGQRRMGKTSVTRELGRRLGEGGWVFLPTDVQGATCPEDVIAALAESVHPIRPVARGFAPTPRRWAGDSIEEYAGGHDVRFRIRASLDAGNWRRYGEQVLHDCAYHERPVLLVIDELPIFLNRLLHDADGARLVDEFLSWLRGTLQDVGDGSLVVLVSGSIGLEPLVRRLGIPDRINHLDPFRLGPWSRETSVACLEILAASYQLTLDDGVADAVYEAIGLGIPHHVQAFFAHLRDFATTHRRDRVSVTDVQEVYHRGLLGPSGQNDLVHYETRLKEGLDDETFRLAKEILAEAAIQRVFSVEARRWLEVLSAASVDDPAARIAMALEILVHDGYLESTGDGYRFASLLLRDWWSARCRGHHTPLVQRRPERPMVLR